MNYLSKISFGIKKGDIIRIVLGSILLAISISVFYAPHGLVTGGVAGIAIVIEHVSESFLGFRIPIAVTNLVFNVPLIIAGFKLKGKEFIWKTIFSTIMLTIIFTIFDYVPKLEVNLFLSTIFGGVFEGLGIGLVMSGFASTGGTVLAAAIVHVFLKHINVACILFSIDFMVIVLGFAVFGLEKAMYAIIAVYIAMKITDIIVEGVHFAKAVFIISEKADEISCEIMDKLGRGITALNGIGKYTSNNKNVLLCVMNKKEIIKMRQIVKSNDKNAFVFVTDVNEVLGEGFISKDRK